MVLTHLVEVREKGGGGGEWWKAIAAFNVEQAASNYAQACHQANPTLKYRFREITLKDLDLIQELNP